uniref:phosphoenolpyruvate carboxylase n=2 Tax=Gammaproteobacteria TaxID=1236 RepID=UPI00329680DE
MNSSATVSASSPVSEYAAPDLPLRDDVRRLGAVVGDMLAEQVSPEFLDQVEAIRTAAIARRQKGESTQGLAQTLAGMPAGDAQALIRAFSAYFQV